MVQSVLIFGTETWVWYVELIGVESFQKQLNCVWASGPVQFNTGSYLLFESGEVLAHFAWFTCDLFCVTSSR